ncbi:MAG TPA: FAD-dependent oxidoreductase [Syntrophobacteraceae bacterium]|nr:FAD-dependent oxidoreductase [Syntrophobacteraceae bacterium]
MDMDMVTGSDVLKACRRCEDCGVRAEVKSDDEEMCILQCSLCGKEYPFYKSPLEDRVKRKIKDEDNIPPADTYDIIIVGGGPGGLAAGIYAMRAAMKTILIEKGAPGGQMAIDKSVENYPGFIDINGFELSEKFLLHAKWYGLEILQEEAVAIEPGIDFHSVRLANGKTLRGYTIIMAPGGVSRTLGVPGEAENLGRGVSYCATCDGFFFKGKPVAVVGGGDTALEEALYLSKIASEVHLIHRREEFRAGRILQERIRREPKINVTLNTVVTSIISNGKGVASIMLRNSRGEESQLNVEGIFIFIGFSANGSLVPAGVKMSAGGYVLTDEKCESSICGIFAVGDLREKYANQIVVAASDGCISALAAARAVEMKKAGFTACKLQGA